MISPEELREICGKYNGYGYFCGKEIPFKKLLNAKVNLGVPEGDEVFALIDCTVFGSAKHAIVVSSSGLYAKNIKENPQHYSWEVLRELFISDVNDNAFLSNIVFNDGRKIDCVGATAKGGKRMVSNVIAPLITALISELNAVKKSSQWLVAVASKQQGPYDKSVLIKMAADRKIDPASAMVWSEGLSDWVPMESIAELRLLTNRNAAAPLPTISTTSKGEVEQAGTADTKVAPTITSIDVNNVALDDLLLLPGMTMVHAQRLDKERRTRFGFTTIEEIGELLEWPPHKVEQLRRRVVIAAYAPTGSRTHASKRVIDF